MLRRCGLALLAVLLLMTVPAPGVLADTQDVTITYSGVQVYIDGVLTSFTDEYGKPIEPFIYNGKVYLPLNSVADALGMSYAWDGSAMSAYMGVAQGEDELLIDVCPPYEIDENHVDRFSSSDGTSFKMAGVSYTNGYTFRSDNRYALFNLNGAYESLSFTLGHVDGQDLIDAVLQIYLDGDLAQELKVPAEGLPQQVTIPLNHALSMKWLAIDESSGYNTKIGLGEINLK